MKSKMKVLAVIAVMFFSASPLLAVEDTDISGVVLHAETRQPVAGAHVYISGNQNGAVTNADGRFQLTLTQERGVLIVSHLGFKNYTMAIDTASRQQLYTILIEPVFISSDDIIITAGSLTMRYSGIYSDNKARAVEDHMGAISGLDMVTRANFAKDPVIRGLRDARVDVLVDGMRLTPACVDGMDPATAYIEADNLKSIEISRGHDSQLISSNTPGGSVNFAMARPVLNSGIKSSTEMSYHGASHQRIAQTALSYGDDSWAVRISGTYRNAGNLMAGNGGRISGSGFEKGNLFTSLIYQPGSNHSFNLRYIGDFAGKIGYPKLLMDTRRADAHIAGLEHTWSSPSATLSSLTTNVYINRIEHWMDDYDRDVITRDVMSGMFMSMFGKTVTAGISSELSAAINSHLLNLKMEAYSIDAFADMLMEPVNSDISTMYLVNLGDISQRNALLAVSYRYFGRGNWIFGANAMAETGLNQIREKSARATYRAEYPEISNLEPAAFGYMAGLSAEYKFGERAVSGVRISEGARLPGHLERYGYYIYQPLDGFFYIGNPSLKTERSRQGELFITLGNDRSRLSSNTSLWVNRMDRYIAGHRTEGLFKQYGNMGAATLVGFETDLNILFNNRWSSAASVAYVFGHHNKLDEPLPMIPPLKGHLSVQRQAGFIAAETRLRWVLSQNRIARQNSLETRTGGYALLDVYTRFNLGPNLTLQIGAENILNHFYTDHLSVNAMPGAGRNIHGSLRVSF